MGNAFIFELEGKAIAHTTIDQVEVDELTPKRFAWLDAGRVDFGEIRPLLLSLGIPEAEVDELLNPEHEYWSQHHQEYVLSKIQVCQFEGDGLALVPLIVVMKSSAILTASGGVLPVMDRVYDAYRESFESVGKSPVFIYFLLWDAIVDGFLPNISRVDDELEELEEEYMGGNVSARILDRIAKCKRMVRALKRSLLPMQRVMRHLGGARLELVSDEARAYLNQLFEHMDRLSQSIDSLQDRVHAALQGYNSVLSKQQNNILKVLTIIATIMMPLSLIAAIYGMNFEFMPELRTKYGYFIVLGVMAVLGGTMLVVFKRRRWL